MRDGLLRINPQTVRATLFDIPASRVSHVSCSSNILQCLYTNQTHAPATNRPADSDSDALVTQTSIKTIRQRKHVHAFHSRHQSSPKRVKNAYTMLCSNPRTTGGWVCGRVVPCSRSSRRTASGADALLALLLDDVVRNEALGVFLDAAERIPKWRLTDALVQGHAKFDGVHADAGVG